MRNFGCLGLNGITFVRISQRLKRQSIMAAVATLALAGIGTATANPVPALTGAGPAIKSVVAREPPDTADQFRGARPVVWRAEIQFYMKTRKDRLLGVTLKQFGKAVGDFLRSRDKKGLELSDLQNLRVHTESGRYVPLNELARVDVHFLPRPSYPAEHARAISPPPVSASVVTILAKTPVHGKDVLRRLTGKLETLPAKFEVSRPKPGASGGLQVTATYEQAVVGKWRNVGVPRISKQILPSGEHIIKMVQRQRRQSAVRVCVKSESVSRTATGQFNVAPGVTKSPWLMAIPQTRVIVVSRRETHAPHR